MNCNSGKPSWLMPKMECWCWNFPSRPPTDQCCDSICIDTFASFLTKSRDARASLGALKQMPLLRWLPYIVGFCRFQCAVAMTASDRSVHSLISFPNDLHGGLPSIVPCRMGFGSVPCRQTWPNDDSLRRFMADIKIS